jgi:protein-S-isoprenylcysteine O-methyltransferase Ste14
MSDRLRRRRSASDRARFKVIEGGAASRRPQAKKRRGHEGAGEVHRDRSRRLSRPLGLWGAGPRVVLITVACGLAVELLAARFAVLRIGSLPGALAATAWILLAASLLVWLAGARQMRAAAVRGRLVTGGLFAYVRNPIYSAFILLACPALALFIWAWPALGLPLIAYLLFRWFLPAEEAVLARRFGAQYAAYRRRVPGLIPRLRT